MQYIFFKHVLRIFLMGSSVLKWPSILVRMNTKAIKKGKGYTFRLHRYKCNETRPGSISRQFENVSLIWMSGFLEWKEKIYAKPALALLCCMIMVIIMRMQVNLTISINFFTIFFHSRWYQNPLQLFFKTPVQISSPALGDLYVVHSDLRIWVLSLKKQFFQLFQR